MTTLSKAALGAAAPLLLLGTSAFAQAPLVRVNCGGPALVLDDGVTAYSADVEYLPGVQGGFVGGEGAQAPSGEFGSLVGGPGNPLRDVHFTARQGWTAYRFEVPAGDYIVRLQFSENHVAGAGLREFDVAIEGLTVLSGLDLAAEVGLQYGAEFACLATVADGVLDIVGSAPGGASAPLDEAPIVSGIEIWDAPASFGGAADVTGLEARASYQRNLVTWDWQLDPELEGYRVYGSDDAAGPFELETTLWAGPPRFLDEDAAAGQTRHYRVAALGLDGVEGTLSPPVSATALDPADSDLPVYDVTIAPADLEFISEFLFEQPSTEVPAVFEHDGLSWPAVEVRYRGNISKTHSKQSWKIKFPPSDRFEGRDDLNLKASYLDESLVRERLTTELFAAADVLGFGARHVHLRVNGEYRGVFVEVEQVDERFLAARDRNPDVNLYKAEGTLAKVADPAEYEFLYEKKISAEPGNADLVALIDFLHAAPGPNFVLDLATRFDIDSYLSYLAVIGWTGDADNTFHNYFMSHDLGLGRWELLPWDSDVGLGVFFGPMLPSVLWGTSATSPFPDFINQLRERVLADEALLWRYAAKLIEFDARFGDATQTVPRVQELVAEIQADVLADPFKNGWESPERFLTESALLDLYLPARSVFVVAEASALGPTEPPTEIWINELVAADQDLFADEAGEFEDWVELYNASAAAVDVGGMFLTDDFEDPMQYTIPTGTTIPAGGHLLVICDKDVGIAELHANFKLSSGGEELGLIAADGVTVLDFVHFGPQVKNVSYGRGSDAGAFFEPLGTPTPGTANTGLGNLPPRITWVEQVPAQPTSADAVTITARVTDAGTLSAVELDWRIDGGAFTTVAMTPLGAERFEAVLPAQPDGTVVEYALRAEDALGAVAWKPLDAPDGLFLYVPLEPAPSPVLINEFMASNDATIEDPDGPAGDFDDWVELFNASAAPVDVGGMFLSDDLSDPQQWEIPGSHVIAPGGHLLIWCDNEPLQGELHATFKLSGGGESVGLFDSIANGNVLLDGLSYAAQTADVAQGPVFDGLDADYRLLDPTPGAPNTAAPGTALRFGLLDESVNNVALSVVQAPVLGGTYTIEVNYPDDFEVGVLLYGKQLLDLPLPPLGVALFNPSPNLYQVVTTDALGFGTLDVGVPTDASFLGFEFLNQVLLFDEEFSNGVQATIGS